MILAALAGMLAGRPAHAHSPGMTAATARFASDGRFRVDIFYDVNALVAGVQPGHLLDEDIEWWLRLPPAARRAQLDEARELFRLGVTIRFDGDAVPGEVLFAEMESAPGTIRPGVALPGNRVRFEGRAPANARTFGVTFDEVFGPVALTVHAPDGSGTERALLAPGKASVPYALDGGGWQTSRLQVALDYLVLGYEHILPKGLDHILFVLGLFLLNARMRPLLLQVTAFTVAHSVTLALSMYGVLSLPSGLVEPLIALSIAYVALENVVTSELKPWRPAVVFGFGLLHGLGFAGVLRELGLPRSEFITALITFNVGVELGQLSVIALAFLAAGWFHSRAWYRTRMAVPASLAIAAVGLYWAVERTFFAS